MASGDERSKRVSNVVRWLSSLEIDVLRRVGAVAVKRSEFLGSDFFFGAEGIASRFLYTQTSLVLGFSRGQLEMRLYAILKTGIL